MHAESSPLAGQTVKAKLGYTVVEYRVEDWWDKITGGSWMFADGNPAALNYAMRSATNQLPIDDEVLYGKVGAFGHLVHISEIVTSG